MSGGVYTHITFSEEINIVFSILIILILGDNNLNLYVKIISKIYDIKEDNILLITSKNKIYDYI